MKRATTFLSLIRGPNVHDWVNKWVGWIVREYQNGRLQNDEYYWDQVSQGFEQAYSDTGAREKAEEKLRNLAWDQDKMDRFLAQFQSLAQEAGYDWNTQPTLTLLASKLPIGMLHHLYKVTRPQNFQDWINGI